MKRRMQNPLLPLEVLDFEVHAVYGAHLDVKSDSETKGRWSDWFEAQQQELKTNRESWTPYYRDHCSTITTEIETPAWCETIKVVHPQFFWRDPPDNRSTLAPILMRVSRFLTVRKDGGAAVTIRLKADRRNTPYELGDILAPLLLAPRIMGGIKLHPQEVEVSTSQDCRTKAPPEVMSTTPCEIYRPSEGNEQGTLLEQIDRMADDEDGSPLFKLFLGTLKDVVSHAPHPNWCEYDSNDSAKPDKLTRRAGFSFPHQVLPGVGDTQIPNFVVFATVPSELYDDAFLEVGAEGPSENRHKYTRHLAAILLRWLSPHNAQYISMDYINSLGLLENGVFVNKYMNSLSFVTYSSTGTLCVRPESPKSNNPESHSHGELDPQEATYGSVLRCVELSRLRWHHALRLNRLLDDLTEEVIEYDDVKGFEGYLSKLLTIRAEAALHFLDPLTYQWDATVGADIARFLQVDVIERIEEECLRKLEMVKEMIHEKLDVLRARAMKGILRPQK